MFLCNTNTFVCMLIQNKGKRCRPSSLVLGSVFICDGLIYMYIHLYLMSEVSVHEVTRWDSSNHQQMSAPQLVFPSGHHTSQCYQALLFQTCDIWQEDSFVQCPVDLGCLFLPQISFLFLICVHNDEVPVFISLGAMETQLSLNPIFSKLLPVEEIWFSFVKVFK